MTYHREAWQKEVTLLRPTVLTEALFEKLGLPNPTKNWVPESVLPLFRSEIYASLSEAQRLRYNHAYARQLAYEFVWLERYLIRPPLVHLLSEKRLEKEVMLILCSFISDETSHIASFELLGKMAAEVTTEPFFDASEMFSPPLVVRQLARLGARFPLTLKFWSDVIIPLEEKAIKIGQIYMRDETVDQVFKEAFINHARDEARHCRLDNLFSDWLQPAGNRSKIWVNKKLAQTFKRIYYANSWGITGPIDEMIKAFPETANQREILLAQTKATRDQEFVSTKIF